MGSAQQGMAGRVSDPAFPLHTGDMDWIPTGEVHAFNLSGTREILGTGEIAGPGSYTYEPAGEGACRT